MDRRRLLIGLVLYSTLVLGTGDVAVAQQKKKRKKAGSNQDAAAADPVGMLIAKRQIGVILDADIVAVPPALRKTAREFRLLVRGGSVRLKSLEAIYADGTTEALPAPARIEAEGDTGWLALKRPGGADLATLKAVLATDLGAVSAAAAEFYLR